LHRMFSSTILKCSF